MGDDVAIEVNSSVTLTAAHLAAASITSTSGDGEVTVVVSSVADASCCRSNCESIRRIRIIYKQELDDSTATDAEVEAEQDTAQMQSQKQQLRDPAGSLVSHKLT